MVLALGAAGCAQGGSQQVIPIPAQQNTGVWVTGQGEVMAVPDIAMLSLGIEARADTVAEAQSQAATAMDKVMQALEDSDVDKKDIQTQRYSIYPITKWVKDEREVIIGYRVTNMVVAKIRKIDNAGAIIDAVTKTGGDYTRIQNINFTIDDPSPYYEEARAKAVKDAKSKAEQLADSAGIKLGKPTYISEGATYRPPITKGFYEQDMAPTPTPTTPISPGEMKLTVNVQVVYTIV
jgi:Uncharacterized conserved protein